MAQNEVLSKKDHQKLVSVIQQWHKEIRKKCNVGNSDEAWQECCDNTKQLQLYSKAMHQLATQVWETNNSYTRIDWCNKIIMDYYKENENLKVLSKERQLCSKCVLMTSVSLPVNLLDVGSCYNAFSKFGNNYNILSLDLSPATENVKECDFTKLIITNEKIDEKNYLSSIPCRITHLSAEIFSVVVFSLLLGYLPTPSLRWLCCEKAYQLLKPEGLLLIITPDSKHQNRNAPMMKSWKLALQQMGFIRIKYEKLQHLHCMAFRKRHKCDICLWKKEKDNPTKDESDYLDFKNGIYIPQDFQTSDDENPTDIRIRDDDDKLRQGFLLLPFNT